MIKMKLSFAIFLILAASTWATSRIWRLSESKRYEKGNRIQTFCIRNDISGTFIGPSGYVTPEVKWAYDIKLIGRGPKYGWKHIQTEAYVGDSLVIKGGYILTEENHFKMQIELEIRKSQSKFEGNGSYEYVP